MERSNEALMGIYRPIELQHASDGRKGGTGLAKSQRTRIELWSPDLRSSR
jgi:hypothetical protein